MISATRLREIADDHVRCEVAPTEGIAMARELIAARAWIASALATMPHSKFCRWLTTDYDDEEASERGRVEDCTCEVATLRKAAP